MSKENVELVRSVWDVNVTQGVEAALPYITEDCVLEDFPELPDHAVDPDNTHFPTGCGVQSMRTCVRVTSKGSITGQLQRALAKRDVLAVRSLAGELPTVPLPTAAEITLLLLEREPESYAPAARRLLARLASERAMPLRQLTDIATMLAELEADPAMAAGEKLVSLIEAA